MSEDNKSAVYQDLSLVSDELQEAFKPFTEAANQRGVEYICIAKLMGDGEVAGYSVQSQIANPDMVLSIANAMTDEESRKALKIKAIVVETEDGRVIPVTGDHSLMVDPEAGVDLESPADIGKH